jgi:hypothetical protein
MRRVIITAHEIWEARGTHWQEHLQKYNQAKMHPPATNQHVLNACTLLPQPSLNMFGSLDDWEYTAARAISREKLHRAINLAEVSIELLVKWYWSEDHWMELGRLWGELPQPAPQYEWSWSDGYITLIPMSIAVPSIRPKHKKNKVFDYPNIHAEIKE